MIIKRNQIKENPFPYTDSNKRYHTYDYALRMRYGGKCAKAILDAGFTCPNLDGTRGHGGCIYCSQRGSGDFTIPSLSLREQFDYQRQQILKKWDVIGWIPYLQAHTNTYAPLSVLRRIYEEILSFPDIVGFSIATRADCISEETAKLLAEVAERTDLTVELGLQSIHDSTAKDINRCHTYEEFLEGYYRLRQASDKIRIGIHLIDGLPGETDEMMLETAKQVGLLHPDQIKIHLLHVLKGTVLGERYLSGTYHPLSLEEYVSCVVRQLEYIPPEIVIGRVTGDAPTNDLLAPSWSRKKLDVMNHIDRLMNEKNTWQGKCLVNPI